MRNAGLENPVICRIYDNAESVQKVGAKKLNSWAAASLYKEIFREFRTKFYSTSSRVIILYKKSLKSLCREWKWFTNSLPIKVHLQIRVNKKIPMNQFRIKCK